LRKVVLKTYQKLWKMPFKIYSIDNLKLLIPVNPWDVAVFSLAALFMILISKILFFIKIPFVLNYIIIPWIITKIADNVKLDGKKPYKYFWDLLNFHLIPKEYERFKPLRKDSLKGFNEKFLIRKKENKNYLNRHHKFIENTQCIKRKEIL
jgi:hypothetical protein